MERPGEPRKNRSIRKPAGQAAQSLLALILLSTASGCATYDMDRSRPVIAKSRNHAQRPANYIVERGDTVNSIARGFGLSPEAIIDANSFDDPDNLLPGQRIQLPRSNGSMRIANRVTPVHRSSLAAPVRVFESRDLDAPAEGLDPRIEGARFYALEGPRAKPVYGPVSIPVTVDDSDAVEPDLDAAYDPKSRKPKTEAVVRSSGEFIWPVRGKVISAFGLHNGGLHNDGINIAADPGTPVKAAEGGTVVYAGNELASYGNLLLIRHPSGFVTAYAHNRRLLVKKDQKVKRGQLIAHVGDTGDVDRPQLHFEIRRGEKAVDPKRYLVTATASR